MDLFCRPFINIMILLQYVLSTKAQSISTTSLLEQRLEMLETNNHIRMNDLELEIRRLNAELNEQKACVDSLQATIGELRRSSPESHGKKKLFFRFSKCILLCATLYFCLSFC